MTDDHHLLVSTIPLDEFEEPFPVDRLVEVLQARSFTSDRDDLIEGLLWPCDGDGVQNFLTYIVFPEAGGILFSWQLKPEPELYSCADADDLDEVLHTAWDDPFPRGCVLPFTDAWEVLRQFAANPEAAPSAARWIPRSEFPTARA